MARRSGCVVGTMNGKAGSLTKTTCTFGSAGLACASEKNKLDRLLREFMRVEAGQKFGGGIGSKHWPVIGAQG